MFVKPSKAPNGAELPKAPFEVADRRTYRQTFVTAPHPVPILMEPLYVVPYRSTLLTDLLSSIHDVDQFEFSVPPHVLDDLVALIGVLLEVPAIAGTATVPKSSATPAIARPLSDLRIFPYSVVPLGPAQRTDAPL